MTWKPHVTVAAVIERNGKFLMVEEESDGKIVFNQPAGHLEPGETLIQAVKRETREETAWSFTPESLTGIYQWKNPESDTSFLRFSFSGLCSEHDPEQALDEGIIRAVWMHPDELIEHSSKLRSPMVLQCINDYLENKRYPLSILYDLNL
jgi:ADP-ribose pyrophosphatase YjhB (NUDIX family)